MTRYWLKIVSRIAIFLLHYLQSLHFSCIIATLVVPQYIEHVEERPNSGALCHYIVYMIRVLNMLLWLDYII